MSDTGQHILRMIPIGGSTQANTKTLRIACKVVDDAPANLVVSERPWLNESKTYQLEKSVYNGRLNGEGEVISFGFGKMQIQEVAKGRD